VIEARTVTKRFGRRTVLNDLDLKIDDGEIIALMGPNGAGKTTLLRLMSTLAEPTRGDVFLDGKSVYDDPVISRKSIGVVGHATYTYDDLTALENLRFFWSLYGMPGKDFEAAGKTLLQRVGLSHRMNDRVAIFSKGMRQRLAIARAILHSPKVLLLDEPFSSLDEKGNEMLAQILAEERSRGCSILIVTHDVQRISSLADRAEVLVRGKIERSFDRASIARGELEAGYRASSDGGIV
jgi:heme ABC exporter ATP-binding subunit CcmA